MTQVPLIVPKAMAAGGVNDALGEDPRRRQRGKLKK